MRLYVCDRCNTKHPSMMEDVAIPSSSFFRSNLNVELCEACVDKLLTLVRAFMKEKPCSH